MSTSGIEQKHAQFSQLALPEYFGFEVNQTESIMSDGKCMASGCICYYNACDFDNFVFCLKGACDCLCIRQSCCLAINAKHRGCGITTNKEEGEICKIGLFCCDLGLIRPNKLCVYASQCLGLDEVASFPFNKEYVGEPVCACCFIQCIPECGVCVAPPDCPALDKILQGESMDRGEVGGKAGGEASGEAGGT